MKKRLLATVASDSKPEKDFATHNKDTREALKYRKQGIVQSWSPSKRAQFERDILTRTMSLSEISLHYHISASAVSKYKKNVLEPAIKAAAATEESDRRITAREHLHHLYGEVYDSIDYVKGRKKDKQGVPIPVTARTIAAHGNVAALLGLGLKLVETHGKMTGELCDGPAPTNSTQVEKQIIQVISLPKISGTPDRGGRSAIDYGRVKIVDAPVNPE